METSSTNRRSGHDQQIPQLGDPASKPSSHGHGGVFQGQDGVVQGQILGSGAGFRGRIHGESPEWTRLILGCDLLGSLWLVVGCIQVVRGADQSDWTH